MTRYIALDKNMRCRGLQYKVGGVYFAGLILYPSVFDCAYTHGNDNIRICEVTCDDTEKNMTIIKEITRDEVKTSLTTRAQNFHENGELYLDCNFVDGLLNGEMNIFYENGKLQHRRFFNNGNPTGEWAEWDEDDNMTKIQPLCKGEKYSRRNWGVFGVIATIFLAKLYIMKK